MRTATQKSGFGLRGTRGKTCAAVTFGAIALGSVAIATPASADATVLETPSITMLGAADRMNSYTDEFRADFTVRVPKGQVPTKIEYNSTLSNENRWRGLAATAYLQETSGANYTIVKTQSDGDYDIHVISARGTMTLSDLGNTANYLVGVRVTTPGGVTVQKHIFEAVTRNSTSGRPVAAQATGTTTRNLPGYVGPNSLTGWSNVVTADSSEQLNGAKFHVDALSSGRSSANGCNVTASLYYQFVRGDNGAPASITPEPVEISIPTHTSGVRGALLAGLGNFELDESGYYKLLVWPQATSSSGNATQDCRAVAWNPEILSEGSQIGSVFWKLDDYSTATADTKVAVATPAADEVVTVANPVFTGVGQPGATIYVTEGDTILGTTTVDEEGAWSLTLDTTFEDGEHTVSVFQENGDQSSSTSVTFGVAVSDENTNPGDGENTNPGDGENTNPGDGENTNPGDGENTNPGDGENTNPGDGENTNPGEDGSQNGSFSLLSPAVDGTVNEIRPVFSGKGEPGGLVLVKGNSGRVLAAATVDENGDWSATSTIDLDEGRYVGTVVHNIRGVDSTTSFSYTIVIPAEKPAIEFALSSPEIAGTTTSSTPVFTGTGTPGALIEVRGNSGRVVASATVDEDGTWSATSTIELSLGRYVGQVFHVSGNATESIAFDYTIAATLTLTSPTAAAPGAAGHPTFTGIGAPGATVKILGNSGRVVATATADETGAWSAESDLDLPAGYYIGSAHHYYNNVLMDSVVIDYNLR